MSRKGMKEKEFPGAEEFLHSYAEEDLLHRIALGTLLFRREKGLTQEELAKKLGKSQSFISELEAGLRNITLRTLALLAFTLERDPQDFVRPHIDLEAVAAQAGRKAGRKRFGGAV